MRMKTKYRMRIINDNSTIKVWNGRKTRNEREKQMLKEGLLAIEICKQLGLFDLLQGELKNEA